MGQNLALNIADKGFPISVYNRTTSKIDETLDRARTEGQLPMTGHYTPRDFVLSIKKPRSVIIAGGAPVDQTIAALTAHMEPGDNFVKMVHNAIEYGDMQLISEAYDVLKNIGGLSDSELAETFDEWNRGELESFLIEITADIFKVKDEHGEGEFVDKVLDKIGMKGTGEWTGQQAADLSVSIPTIAASLDWRFLSGLKDEKAAAANVPAEAGLTEEVGNVRSGIDKKRLIDDARQALYASKICRYAQGMDSLRAKSNEENWNLNFGELARIWKGGCIIRAVLLDRIKKAYGRNPNLESLLVDPDFTEEMVQREKAWRRVVGLAVTAGISTPGMCASLTYFNVYRGAMLHAN